MKTTLLAGVSLSVVSLLLPLQAQAADLGRPTDVAAMPQMMGYVQVYGGGGRSTITRDGSDPANFNVLSFGGAGRGVIDLGSSTSDQVDAWADFDTSYYDSSENTWDNADAVAGGGIANHVSWHVSDNDLLGVMATLGVPKSGQVADGLIGGAAIEAAHSQGDFRLYAQAGILRGLTGYEHSEGMQDLYASLQAQYFINPDLMLQASVGGDRWTSDEYADDVNTSVFWGAKAEYKLIGLPASFYVEYKGMAHNYSGGDLKTDHRVMLGLRVPFGTDSLQTLENQDGLKDFNPIYGDPSPASAPRS